MLNGYPNPEGAKIYWRKSRESLEVATYCYIEGHYNNCVTRSYYSIYQGLCCALIGNGKLRNSDKHKVVINDFITHYTKSKKLFPSYKNKILKLMELRILADYKLIMMKEKDAKNSLSLAESLLDSIESVFNKNNNFYGVFDND
jgi:uncharacterized protein (UPF0332 family)